jgi:hypothetical protein
MRQRDWTPAVLLSGTVCVTLVAMVWVTTPWLWRSLVPEESGPGKARHLPPPEVSVWAGEVVPGVKGLLGPVWGDPDPDRRHDEGLNETLLLSPPDGLAWYRLLLFNTTSEERSVRLADGTLTIRPSSQHAEGETAVPLRSLLSMERRGEVTIPPARRVVLETLGALDESVRLPAGSMASLLIPFTRRVDLGAAQAVATEDGTEFHRRPMPRAELQALLYDPPDLERVKDL